jgi:5-methylcytosine-specific restriction enzyme subunit McrC
MAAASNHGPQILTLPEYEAVAYARWELAEETMALLHATYPTYVDVQPPFVTGSGWKLTSLGWVGYLPVTENLALSLLPKTPIHNLLRMLEIAYQFDVKWGKSLFEAETIADLYERLAMILANCTIARCRQGIYRTYVGNAEELAYVRGRIDVTPLVRQPWRARLHCEYEEHTADVEENQLILWTLNCILRSGLCREDHALPHVRHAFRLLQQHSGLQPFPAAACRDRTYSRLNSDYQVIHALCYFFLDHTGPSHRVGNRLMMPFLVNMAKLFELFVATWLRKHLLGSLQVLEHQRYDFHARGGGSFDADLVIRDAESGRALCVMDTKYKVRPSPNSDDVAQVVAYAVAFGAPEAVLIYPSALAANERFVVGNVIVRTLAFHLNGDLEQAGNQFVQGLLDL